MNDAQCTLLRQAWTPQASNARPDGHAPPSSCSDFPRLGGDEQVGATRSLATPPGRSRRPPPWRLPPVAETDDDNRWVTGRCWLWCGRESARVVWLGPATALGVSADVFACEACAQSLADQILDAQMVRDACPELGLAAVGAVRPHALSPPAGRHRRRP